MTETVEKFEFSNSVIQRVMDEYQLQPLLYKRFGDDTGLFLDLVAYLIVEEENQGQCYPDFAYTHPLFSDKMTIYSDSKVSRFLHSISKDQSIGFLDDWNKGRDHKNRIYVSYDSTNKNCQTGDIDLVEFGKAKDEKGLPVFNLSIAMDKTNRIPLFYEEYFFLHYSRKGIFLGADERTDVIERKLKLCGYYCIITSEKMTAAQSLIQYAEDHSQFLWNGRDRHQQKCR